MTKISALTPLGDGLAVGDQFIIRDIDDAGTPNKSVTISGITRGLAVGTALAPSIAFAADKNTGIYGTGSDVLALVTAGENRLHITSGGLVGIGTTSPGGKLVISDGSTTFQFDPVGGTGNILRSLTSAGARDSLLFDGSQFVFANSATNYGQFDSSGRFLVGTTTFRNSNSLFEVVGGNGGVITLANDTTSIPGANYVFGQINFYTADTSGGNTGIFAKITAESNRVFDGDSASGMDLKFYTGTVGTGANTPTERMRIGQDGLVNINSGKFKVDQNGVTNISITNDANANGFVFDTGDGGAGNRPKFKIRYGTADQIYLDGSGNAEKPGGGSWTAISDSRAKENIVDYTSGLDQLKQIQPRSYRYIGNETTYIGLVAQEVEDAMPELVKLGEGKLPDGTEVTDFRTLNQTPLTFALINAVKEMAEQIDLLKAKVTALEGA